jgi:hypothetical protein
MALEYWVFVGRSTVRRRGHQPHRLEIVLPDGFEAGDEDFHLLRAGPKGVRIGGSECATAMGCGSFRDRADLACEKTQTAAWYASGKRPGEKPRKKIEQETLADPDGMIFVQLHEGLLREPEMRLLFTALTGLAVLQGNYWTFDHEDESVGGMELSWYFGVLPDGRVPLGEDEEGPCCPLELKVSVYAAVDFLLLDHACQCFYQMWIMGSDRGYYQNCSFEGRRAFQDGRTYPFSLGDAPDRPYSVLLLMLLWDDAFWAWMEDHLLEFVSILEGGHGDAPSMSEGAEEWRLLIPPINGVMVSTQERVRLVWTAHPNNPRKTIAFPFPIDDDDDEGGGSR